MWNEVVASVAALWKDLRISRSWMRLRTRVERYFQFETVHLKLYREELMRVVRTLIDEGEIPRTRVQEITGKGATVSAEIIKLGLQEGLVDSPSPKGPLQPGFPPKILEFYFPQLYVDLPTEEPGRDDH